METEKMVEEIQYGSLITMTKCYGCIHFPLCFVQKGGVNLGLASENDCCYYQPKIPEGAVVLTRGEIDAYEERISSAYELGYKESKNRVVKETAEKFAERLKSIAKDKLELYGWQMVDIDDIDEICKEITEGEA